MPARLLLRRSHGARTTDSDPHPEAVRITTTRQSAHAQDTTTLPMPQSAANDTFAHRSGRASLLLALVLLAVAGIVTALLLTHGVPDAWWPHTGRAFSSTPATAARHNGPCDLIVGSARDFCEHADPAAAHRGLTSGDLLRLAAAALGIAILLYLRRRRQS